MIAWLKQIIVNVGIVVITPLYFTLDSTITTKNTTWRFARTVEISLTWEKAGRSYDKS
jgi:hypothetical protein